MLWRRILDGIAYLYLLRVQILTATFLILFPWLSVAGPARALLENLFQLDWWGTYWTAMTAVLASWSVMLTTGLVLVNGASRFRLPQLFRVNALHGWMALASLALSAPTIAGQFVVKSDFGYQASDIWLRIRATIAGIFTAYFLAYLGMLIAVWLAPAGTQIISVEAFPAPGFLGRWLVAADGRGPFVARWVTAIGSRLKRLPRSVWAGYLDPATGNPWSGHWLAAAFALVTFAVYEYEDFHKRLNMGLPTHLPAVVFVLWLILNANWILGFAAFFLDRFRIPLIAPFVLACLLASLTSQSDHYFQVEKAGTHQVILPRDVLRARAKGQPPEQPIIVVATAGGGIQAAVWTAKVLTGLQKDSLGWNPGSAKWPADFASSLAMVSSVSGGATGAMFFLNRYRDGPRPGLVSTDLDSVVSQAAASSLDDVAWALVDHDIPRLYYPYSLFSDERFIDRGRMLELSWQNKGNVYANLADWRQGVLDCAACTRPQRAWRPATIFNSTIVESGRPLLLGTTDLEGPGQTGPWSFYDWVPSRDLPVVTAVRLAATFPYVSPAAAPYTEKPEDHAVDGGYYDNLGVATLVEWLSQGLAPSRAESAKSNLQANIDAMPHILVIQIRSFPDDADPAPTPKSAAFQLAAPADTLLNVRNTGQVIRDAYDLRRMQSRWTRSDGTPVVQVATIRFLGENAPLSWAINSRQLREVDTQWDKTLGQETNSQCPCAPGISAPEEDLQLVRCVMQRSETKACRDLMIHKQPW